MKRIDNHDLFSFFLRMKQRIQINTNLAVGVFIVVHARGLTDLGIFVIPTILDFDVFITDKMYFEESHRSMKISDDKILFISHKDYGSTFDLHFTASAVFKNSIKRPDWRENTLDDLEVHPARPHVYMDSKYSKV